MRGILVIAAVLALAGCTAPPAETPPSPPAPTIETVPQCSDFAPSEFPDADGSEAIAAAAQTAQLPHGAQLNPGVQIITSVDDPGNYEVVARICSDGLTRDQLVDTGAAIAQAIYTDPSAELVTELVVSAWIPGATALERQPGLDTIRTDYELFLWDNPGPSNWK